LATLSSGLAAAPLLGVADLLERALD